MAAKAALEKKIAAVFFAGKCEELISHLTDASVDLIISSPPYCMGKEYEDAEDLESFKKSHDKILPELVRVLKPGGSLCWQVGFHVANGSVTPLDMLVFQAMQQHPSMHLRNRIVWTFGHGLHCAKRFSGRHETVLWFTKGNDYSFDIDAVRVEQKYPGKRHSRGPQKGKPSGNPLGKNPTDVWAIPNVNANHVEKTKHPCQFPVGLAHRLVRALSKKNQIVFDPFSGVASTGVAALLASRRFLGAEPKKSYVKIGMQRLNDTLDTSVQYRPAEQEIYVPKPTDKVAQRPREFDIAKRKVRLVKS